jgi:tripeptide aminopeptidase
MTVDYANRALHILMDLLAIDSPTGQEEAIRTHLVDQLHTLGLSTELDAMGNLYARLPASPAMERENTVLLNSHMDTVPTGAGVKPRLTCDGNTLVSDGTTALGTDDKAGLAAILTALETIVAQQLHHGPLVLLFTVAEETGLQGATQVEVERLGKIDRGYTLDADGQVGKVIHSAANKSRINIVFHGRSAHAGFCPETGISAISMASRAIDTMRLLRIDEETTANVGSIHGGEVTNIVCDTVQVVMEVRSITRSKVEAHIGHLRTCCEEAVKAFGGSCDFVVEELYPGYRIDPDDTGILYFKGCCERLGLPFTAVSTGGGSDANILRGKGIPILVLGCGYEAAHTSQESIRISELGWMTELLLVLTTL